MRPCRNGGTCLVDIEQLPVQPAVLVKVAVWDLDPHRVLDPTRLHRVEPGCGDETFDRSGGTIVVCRVEEDGAARGAIRFACERRGGPGTTVNKDRNKAEAATPRPSFARWRYPLEAT